MSQWMLPIRCHREVYCPGCACDLAPDVTRFRWGVAFCACCHGRLNRGQVERIAAQMMEESLDGHVSWVVGLHFWTPKGVARPRYSLLAISAKDPVQLEQRQPCPDVPLPR